MRKRATFLALSLALLWVLVGTCPAEAQVPGGWKAGVARAVITPKESLWMAGFAVRSRPSEGVLHDLWAKVLVLEDATGQRAVLVTTDLLGFPKGVSDTIRARLQARFALTKAQVILNSSHTHSGPVLENALSDIYPLDDEQRRRISRYSRLLEDQLVALVGQALRTLEPVTLHAESGVTRFQVNRRNNNAATLARVPELRGPNDYAVPVLKVLGAKGELKAVAFGYACHPVVLDLYQWSGDYVGFAQLELEKAHPGTLAMFFQGAAGDQNPLPRHTVPLARQYGRELAAAVERVLEDPMRPLAPTLAMAYSEVDLALAKAPTEEELTQLASSTSVEYYKRWANRMRTNLKKGETFQTNYPYPIQVWRLGDQPLVSLGGEVVVEYAIKIKQLLGPGTFVMAYSNDVMGYIPSATVLQEGGYEGATSQMVYGLPAPWQASIEATILAEIVKVAQKAGVPTH
ncbi:hypothetical protein GCM10027275_23260 [Rhabdobacter roseus]|uniref:Neutral/alkaline non-lysosomal ceramidase N-terminal domain-containing protein n=1 Tax=Rhabdobacter roseus TaxID=1655419 RepID=A0A840TJ89_9BACT|nr:neutral/alkaline non-lysosomal ceramidase N-terminal domain-containing protein [Rhabdobacter roseus]MBB5284266.1 hypothetical protein [Rhabdobacter roseus]